MKKETEAFRLDRRALEADLALAGGEAQHQLQRLLSQLEFAEGLCELHSGKASDWRRLIARAGRMAEAAAGRGSLQALRQAVKDAEKVLAPISKIAKSYLVYCAGHAHIDMNWMWSWPETVGITNDTFETVLRLMEEYPEFHFTQSQASVYALIEEHHPALLDRIRQRIKEGRWEVAASHWVEGDKNLAGGEALCRHLLYTRRFMQRVFGLKPEDAPIDWSPDTFGHAATIPSYLVRGGVKYYYGHRFGAPRPRLFWWEAPDKSRVLVRNDQGIGYNCEIRPHLSSQVLNHARQTGLREMLWVYGVGDHGGGPTRRDLEWARELNSWPVFPTVKLSTAVAFFQAVERQGDKLPVLKGELNFEFTGCYTTQTLIKKCNRFAETQLGCAEVLAACAWAAVELPYPEAALRRSWQDTLFSHFHDILPGSGVHDTRTYTHGLFQKTAAHTGMAETLALRALAAGVNTGEAGGASESAVPPGQLSSSLGSGAGYGTLEGLPSAASQAVRKGPRPFLVFNPTGATRGGTGMVAVWENARDHRRLAQKPFTVVAPSGKRWRAQAVHSEGYWGHDMVRLAFPLDPLPALGYAVYTVLEEETPAPAPLACSTGAQAQCSYAPFEASRFGLENEFLRAEVDQRTAGLRSLVCKDSGVELLDPARPAGVLEFEIERPHGMSAWCVHDPGPGSPAEVLSIKRQSDGPYVAAIAVKLRVRSSEFVLTYELRAGEPQLELRLAGTWFERGTPETGVPRLRIAFPTALKEARPRYEVPFGAVDRSLRAGEEVPALRWALLRGLVADRPAGLLLLNDCKHGHSLDGDTLRLTLIRSSYEPDILPEIGRHEVRLALVPCAGELEAAAAANLAGAHTSPLRVMGAAPHPGALPATGRFLALSPGNVVLSAFKRAEDADALVVRLFETEGKKTAATLTLDRKLLGVVTEAREADVLERPLARSSVKVEGQKVSVELPPHGLATVLIRARK